MRFLDDARLPLSNNISERALRRQVVGRKNWVFVGNDDAGEVNARDFQPRSVFALSPSRSAYCCAVRPLDRQSAISPCPRFAVGSLHDQPDTASDRSRHDASDRTRSASLL
jgi:hypothetical protein